MLPDAGYRGWVVRRGVLGGSVLGAALLACGPTVGVDGDGGEDGGGSTTDSEATTSESNTVGLPDDEGPDEGIDDGVDEGSGDGAMPSVCGDGIVGPDEACDDGNDADADGCSQRCQSSGTLGWTLDLSPSSGGGVGLEVLDGEAYALVQDYGDLVDTSAIASRVSNDGDLITQFVDEGGLADWDFARSAIDPGPDGAVVLGYPSTGRSVAGIQLGDGVVWSEPLEDFGTSFSTRWGLHGIFTLRHRIEPETKSPEFAVLRFSEEGELVDEYPFSPGSGQPLLEGGLFAGALPQLIALTAQPGGQLRVHELLLSQAGSGTAPWSTLDAAPIGETESIPQAFEHGLEIDIWTDTQRVTVDMLGHTQPPVPRTIPGKVLVPYSGGFVIVEDNVLSVYADDGTLRWTAESGAVPRLARPDGFGGLFVLSDEGWEGSTALLEYWVL